VASALAKRKSKALVSYLAKAREGNPIYDNSALNDPIIGPECVVDLVRPLMEQERENFYLIMLNTRNRPIAVELISVGSLNASIVHPREVMRAILTHSQPVASFVLSHNHPSGDPRPSDDDIGITQRLIDAGELIGIPLLDHVIVGNGPDAPSSNYHSMRAGGELGR